MLEDDRARWMAAAEGTVVPGPGTLGVLLGLASLLLLREGRPDLGCESTRAGLRWEVRAGDVLREDMGEFVLEREAGAFRPRGADFVWFRMGG